MAMTFPTAFELAKLGGRISLESWNDPLMWVEYRAPSLDGDGPNRPWFELHGSNGEIVPWVPNALELFSDRWMVVGGVFPWERTPRVVNALARLRTMVAEDHFTSASNAQHGYALRNSYEKLKALADQGVNRERLEQEALHLAMIAIRIATEGVPID